MLSVWIRCSQSKHTPRLIRHRYNNNPGCSESVLENFRGKSVSLSSCFVPFAVLELSQQKGFDYEIALCFHEITLARQLGSTSLSLPAVFSWSTLITWVQIHWHPGLCWKTNVLITWFGDKGGLLIFPRKIAVKRCLVYGVSRLPQFWNYLEHKSIPDKTTYEYRGCESWELDYLALRRNPMDSDWQGMFVHGLGLLAHICFGGPRSRRVSWELTSEGTCGHQSLCREIEHILLSKLASVRVVFTPGIILKKMCKKKNIGGWHKNLPLT